MACLGITCLVAACDSSDPVEPSAPISITVVSLMEPGDSARVNGRNMDQVVSVTVDGIVAEIISVTETFVTFRVPQLRPCETDGRIVEVRVASADRAAQEWGRMAIDATTHMTPQQMQVLTPVDLACIQLPKGPEGYALALINASTDQSASLLATLRVLGAGDGDDGDGPSQSFQAGPGFADFPSHHVPHPPFAGGRAPEGLDHYPGPSFVPFDDYASAEVGDLVQFVDWDAGDDILWIEEKDDVPTYEGLVLAVEGDQMIIADMRFPAAAELDVPEMRAKAAELAEILDDYMIPSIRAGIDDAFDPPGGAGGRIVSLIRPLPAQSTTTLTPDITEGLPWTSDMLTIVVDAGFFRSGHASNIARHMIHQAAHMADWMPGLRQGGTTGLGSPGGWYSEALAVAVEDIAARLSRGGLAGRDRSPSAGLLQSAITETPNPASNQGSPWGPADGSFDLAGTASASMGARIIRFAQEQYQSGQRWAFHQEMDRRAWQDHQEHGTPDEETRFARWNADAVAATLGLTRPELVELLVFQELVHDFFAPSMETTDWYRSFSPWTRRSAEISANFLGAAKILRRTETLTLSHQVYGGAYTYWYIPPSETAGLSIEGTSISQNEEHRAVLIRVR